MTMIAYAFLQHRRLAEAKGGKKGQRPTTPAEPACRPQGDRAIPRLARTGTMSPLRQASLQINQT